MERKLKLLGHPVHPMLVVFPLGLLSTRVGADDRAGLNASSSLSGSGIADVDRPT